MHEFSLISEVATTIGRIHNKFSIQFYQSDFLKDYRLKNLKKWDVQQAIKDQFFMQKLIPKYREDIQFKISADLLKFMLDYNNFNIRYRTKLKDTIIMKLLHYAYKEKNTHGLYVSKCLNDIFGVRIVLDGVTSNYDKINVLLENLREQKIISRYYYRSDKGYKAFHCYFQMNNKVLPWELQIWDTQDRESNIISHKQHESDRKIY